jgi:hypothetical protein
METSYMGKDLSLDFINTLKLPNGKDLEVKPLDIIYHVTIHTKSSNGIPKKVEFTKVPSSLFEQARTGQKIYFSKNGTNFELKLKATTQYENYLDSLEAPFIKKPKVIFDDSTKIIANSEIYPPEFHNFRPQGNQKTLIGETLEFFSPDTNYIHLTDAVHQRSGLSFDGLTPSARMNF